MFHAWLKVLHQDGVDQIVDFTTWQLRDKAAALDAIDGYRTGVRFCPDYLWISGADSCLKHPREVVAGDTAGDCAYIHNPAIAANVFHTEHPSFDDLARQVLVQLRSIEEGKPLQIIGLGRGGDLARDRRLRAQ